MRTHIRTDACNRRGSRWERKIGLCAIRGALSRAKPDVRGGRREWNYRAATMNRVTSRGRESVISYNFLGLSTVARRTRSAGAIPRRLVL